jgi:hypothetical protein
MSLNYTINPIDNWMLEKTKRGLIKTSIKDYYVEADYAPDSQGKYIFDSGREEIQQSNHVKGKDYNTTSDTFLKHITSSVQPNNNKSPIEDLFQY